MEVWDLAAGAIIVKEAGGIISDYPSGEFNLSSGRILACSPSLENELKNAGQARLAAYFTGRKTLTKQEI